MPRILLIAPDFYDYRESIIHALILQGYDVDSIAEVPGSRVGHYLRKLSKVLFRKYQYKRFARYLDQPNRYDRLLLIRGWMVPHDIPSLFKKANPNARTIMYQWDSKKNNHYDHFIDQVDQTFSFDKSDCEKDARLDYKPLFFKEALISEAPHESTDKSLVFVAGHQELRFKTFLNIKQALKNNPLRIKSHVYIRETAFIKLKAKGMAPPKDEVSFESLPTPKLKDWYNQADVILDICNPNQSGLTMRAIETLGLGKILLTNNKWIKKEPFYSPEQIYVFESAHNVGKWRFPKPEKLVDVSHLKLNNWVLDFIK